MMAAPPKRPRNRPNAAHAKRSRPQPPHPEPTPPRSRPQPTRSRAQTGARPPTAADASSPAGADPRWIAPILRLARERGDRRATELRSRYPQASPRALGERCVATSATRAGLLGAATGTLALIALPIGLPAGVALTLLLEAELLFTLLALYGFSTSGDVGRSRLYVIWAGAGVADAAKTAGVRLGANAVRRVLTGSLPARIIARINPVLLRAILRRLGLGWLPRALKLWPLLGAPVGFALDRAALRALGSTALDVLDDSHH